MSSGGSLLRGFGPNGGSGGGGCIRPGPIDTIVMGEVPENDIRRLHERWRRDDRDDRGWLVVLRGSMTRSARAAIRRMTGEHPNREDVDEAVFAAFREFLGRDPHDIKEPVGLAATISYRRGLDVGRRLNRHREFEDLVPDTDTVAAERDDPSDLTPEDEVLEAERAAERERIYEFAAECIDALPPGQAEVIKATVLGEQELSDWANEKGKSYQAAHKQRSKALAALLGCVKAKNGEMREGGDHVA